MLPNPKNKNIKNLLDNSSESTVNEAEINLKKLKNKRKTIIFSLILTAGLSFLFWSYRSIQSLIRSPPQFNFNLNLKLPKFSLNKNNQTTLPSPTDLSRFLQKSSINWSIFVSLDSDYLNPVFEHASGLLTIDNNLNTTIDKIKAINKSSQSLVNLSLPEGLSFQEIIDISKGVYYQGLVHLPKNKILILIKNNNLTNLSQAQTELPLLIDLLYWHSVNFLN
jgi:hypothetical protein